MLGPVDGCAPRVDAVTMAETGAMFVCPRLECCRCCAITPHLNDGDRAERIPCETCRARGRSAKDPVMDAISKVKRPIYQRHDAMSTKTHSNERTNDPLCRNTHSRERP